MPKQPADDGQAVWKAELQKARVYEQILLDIIVGDLPPGSRLEEKELTRRCKAGLAGVRDALGRLALEGLVVRRPRAGTTVAPLDLVEVRQAYDAKQLIEPHCAALAADHATKADVEAMRAAFSGAVGAIRAGDSRALVGMDQRFHVAIARASRNAILAGMLIPLQHKTARFWVYSMAGDTEEERLSEVERHREVIDRIEQRDADGARRSMMRLLGMTPENMRRAAGSQAPVLAH